MMSFDQNESRLSAAPIAALIVFCLGFLFFASAGIWGAAQGGAQHDGVSVFFGIFICFTFGPFGAFAGALAYSAIANNRRITVSQREHPRRPWMWRADWQRGIVSSNAWHVFLFSLGLSLYVNFFVWGFCVILFLSGDVPAGRPAFALSLCFSAFVFAGFGFAIDAARRLSKARSYGEGTLHLDRVPIGIGEEFSAEFRWQPTRANALKSNAIREFHTTLTCTETRSYTPTTRIPIIGNCEVAESQTYEAILWQESFDVVLASCTENRIAIRLRIPSHGFPTGRGGRAIKWELQVTSNDGLDAEFELPVFKSGDHPLRFAVPPVDQDRMRRPSLVELINRSAGVAETLNSDQVIIDFSPQPTHSFPFQQRAMLALWGLICVGVVLNSWWFGLIFSLIGLAAGYKIIHDSTPFRVEASRQGLQLTRSSIVRVQRLEWTSAEIEGIFAGQRQPSLSELMKICVVVKTRDGREHVLIPGLTSQYFAHKLAEALGQVCRIENETCSFN